MAIRLIAVTVAGWLVAVLRRGDSGVPPTSGPAPSDAATALADLVGDLTTGMLLAMGAWLLLAGLVGAATSIPGPVGRAAGVAWAWLVPRAVRAALAAAVGIGAATTPVWAAGQPAVDSGAVTTGADQVPLVTRPTTQGRWSPSTPLRSAMSPAPRSESASTDRPAQTVTVQHGDSLWALAARGLGPGSTDAEVAAEWPRWYALNRTTIGPDPDLLVTGTVLTVPTPSGENR